MKHFRRSDLVWILALFVVLALSVNTRSQTVENTKKQSSATSSEEPKGEVDLLIEELSKRKEAVLRHCIEKCPDSKDETGQQVSVGESIRKVEPVYPSLARAAHVAGEVIVMLVIDEKGNVIAAQIVSGHPLLQASCLRAARESTFTPTLLEGNAVKVLGTITYRFGSK